jgi:hypothetical protein
VVVRAAAVREAGLEVAVPREGLVAKVVLTEGKVVATGAAVKVAATGEAARVAVARAVVARVVVETAVAGPVEATEEAATGGVV